MTMTAHPAPSFTVNDRTYRLPDHPVVVICIDGCASEYLDAALVRGIMPNLGRMAVEGYRGMCRGALPSFTNTNNASIITGAPPAVHGIAGNFFLDPETGEEVMMNDARFLRAESLLAAASQAGRKVAVATSKNKLLSMLSRGVTGITFSAEKAGETSLEENGIEDVEALVGEPAPSIYSADPSLFVLKAGSALVETGEADFLYLSLTDFIQHKHPPEDPQALDFHAGIDRELGRMLAAGAAIGITADHGMNAKQNRDGSPNVIFLEQELQSLFGSAARVILPITDPYVRHHGSLGSFAMIHLAHGTDPKPIAKWLTDRQGITEVHERATAVSRLELPEDRIGDLCVLSARDVVLGKRPEDHDLQEVATGLRSHGGRYEEMVPFVLSVPLTGDYVQRAYGDLRNFDIFEFTVNCGND